MGAAKHVTARRPSCSALRPLLRRLPGIPGRQRREPSSAARGPGCRPLSLPSALCASPHPPASRPALLPLRTVRSNLETPPVAVLRGLSPGAALARRSRYSGGKEEPARVAPPCCICAGNGPQHSPRSAQQIAFSPCGAASWARLLLRRTPKLAPAALQFALPCCY